MKKLIFTILVIHIFFRLFAQDIIYKHDGTEISSRVIEITTAFIKYKKFEQQSGPIRNIKISDVFMIIYEDETQEVFKKDGTREVFKKSEPAKYENAEEDARKDVEAKLAEEDRFKVEEKAMVDENVHIIKINEEDGKLIAIIDKGSNTKAKGGKPSIGKRYYVYIPNIDTSSITGETRISGEEFIGILNLTNIEYDASIGNLKLIKERDIKFIESNNILRTYYKKTKVEYTKGEIAIYVLSISIILTLFLLRVII